MAKRGQEQIGQEGKGGEDDSLREEGKRKGSQGEEEELDRFLTMM